MRAVKFRGSIILASFHDTGVKISMDGRGRWISYYNTERTHAIHGISTPDEAYESKKNP